MMVVGPKESERTRTPAQDVGGKSDISCRPRLFSTFALCYLSNVLVSISIHPSIHLSILSTKVRALGGYSTLKCFGLLPRCVRSSTSRPDNV